MPAPEAETLLLLTVKHGLIYIITSSAEGIMVLLATV